MIRTSRPLALEQLEDRLTPAGNVTAVVTRLGDLILRGDRFDNHVSIMQVVNDDQVAIRIFAQEGTRLNKTLEQVDLTGVKGSIRIALGRGNDAVDLAALNIPKDLVIAGGAGRDTLTLDEATTTIGRRKVLSSVEFRDSAAAHQMAAAIGPSQVGSNVMQAKLNQAIQMLTTPSKLGSDQYVHAINEGMEAIYLSNLVVLPTFQNVNAEGCFADHLNMAQRLIDALNIHVTKTNVGTPDSKARGLEARNFIQVTMEATETIAQQTAITDPNNPQSNAQLNRDDEGGTYVDTVLGNIFAREMRSPFFILPKLSSSYDEQVILTQPLGPDQAAVIVKEYQGLKVVVTPRVIPIWAFPWFARSSVVGTTTIWCWEFVPAEMIKTISLINVSDGAGGRRIDVSVQTQIILERQLLHFWRFIDKNVTAVA